MGGKAAIRYILERVDNNIQGSRAEGDMYER